jgi:hypothetical protein
MNLFFRVLFPFLFAATALPLVAQVNVTGVVVDPSGAAVANMDVALRRGHTVRAHSTSDALGHFRFTAITAGTYTIEAGGGAFAASRLDLTVGATESLPVTLRLRLAAMQESVDVAASEPQPSVDTSANMDTTSVSGDTLDRLPVLDNDVIGALTPFLDPTAIATGGATIMVDGVEVRKLNLSKSAIQEITINDDPYSAETNRPGRGRIEIFTKSDNLDKVHGSSSFAFRNASLDSANYFAAVKPPEQRRMFEGTFTGPLERGGRTSFLISSSYNNDDATAVVRALTPSGTVSANVSAPVSNTELAVRVTHDFSDRHRGSIVYNWSMDTTRNAGVGGLTLPSAGSYRRSREDDVTYNDRWFISNRVVNQFSTALERGFAPSMSMTNAPSIVVRDAFIAGGAQVGGLRTEHGVKINDVVTVTLPKQTVKFGVNMPNLSHRRFDDETNRGGTFSFASLDDYIAARPYAYTITQGTGQIVAWWREIGVFAQDQVTITPRLHASLGLRYDWQNFFHDKDNFAPRGSIAWAPPTKTRTIIRAGTGLFYDRSGVAPIAAVLLHSGNALRSYTLLNPSYPDPLAGGVTLAGLPFNITRLAPGVEIPRTWQYSTSIERALTKSATIIVGYRGLRGTHMFRSVDVNAPIAPNYNSRPDSAFGQIQEIRSDGIQRSNALDVTLKGRKGRVKGQAQYIYSRTVNDSGGIFWFPADQYASPESELGRADFDQRHRFNALATIEAGWVDVGLGAHFYSGLPYTQTIGFDLFGTGLSNARPTGVGRNTLQGTGVSDVDLKFSKEVSFSPPKTKDARTVTLGFDVFNVFNHTNFTGYVGNIRSPLFGFATSAAPGRRIQFSAEMKF